MDRSLLLPRSPSSHTFPFLVPARVVRPSGHPCSDPFVAPGPHAALPAAALPPQGCSVGPPPWSSPQTLGRPLCGAPTLAVLCPLAGRAPPFLRHQHHHRHHRLERSALPPPRPRPHLLSLSPPLPPPPSAVTVPTSTPRQSQVRMPGITAHPSPLGASATKPCVSYTPDTSGVRRTPSLVQAAIPAPCSRPAELSPDTARHSRPLPTVARRAPLL